VAKLGAVRILVIAFSAAAVWGRGHPADGPRSVQSVNPFYLNRLESGEALIEARQWEEALKEFEVAAFGLASRRDLLAKTYLLMGLCLAKLGSRESAAEKTAAAAGLADWEALLEIRFPETIKADLEKLVAEARRMPPAASPDREAGPETVRPKESPPTEGPPSEAPAKSSDGPALERPDPSSFQGLQAAIQADPRYAAPYYALASLQARDGEFEAAAKTLRDLLRNIPAEVRGHLLLGRYAYEGRKLKEAERSLEMFLNLAAAHPAEEAFRDEARALLVLAAYLQGKDGKARAALAAASEVFDPARFARLTLKPRDLDRLLVLRTAFGKR